MRTYWVVTGIAAANVALALVFFFAGFFVRGWVDQQRTPGPPPGESQAGEVRVAGVRVDGDPATGPPDAPVTIVEFSDFQCPYCQAFSQQTLPLILSTYRDRVRYVFRDFPIASIHPQAQKAAEAAECAFEQGRFWEYHDRLFLHQGALSLADLKTHARAVGLDGQAFERCLESGKYAHEVQKDLEDGLTSGVTGTPTFFINGVKVEGAQPFSVFQAVIERELARAPRR